MKGYFKDKKAHPWHRIYDLIDKYGEKEKGPEELSETIILLRDGLFGALEIHSLSLALDIPAKNILDILLKGKNWNEGRRDVRAFCSMHAIQLISDMQLDYLEDSALRRDGFGYLIPQLEEARLEQYRNARPKKEKGSLILQPLSRTVYGKQILRSLGITITTLKTSDDLATTLLTEYENFLIELETDTSRTEFLSAPTEQLTLNGEPVSLDEEAIEDVQKSDTLEEGVQTPLSEYMSTKKKKMSAKEASRKRRKGRRAKKTSGAKEGKK